jgi:hypothetical protein
VLPPNFYNQGDQGIYAAGDFFIPQEKFRAAPYTVNKPNNPNDVPAGIPAIYQSQGGGGGGGYTGSVNDLTGNFFQTTSDRQDRLTELNYPYQDGNVFFPGQTGNEIIMEKLPPVGAPKDFYKGSIEGVPQTIKGTPGIVDIQPASLSRKIQEKFYNLPFFSKPQSADQIIEEGYTGKSIGPGIVSMMLGKMDQYGDLPRGDQAFIARNMGYTGPTVFGANNSGLSKDVFGLNTRSGFGNYAEAVGKQADKLGFALSDKGKTGGKFNATFNAETGLFEGPEADLANQRTKMMRAKLNFYQKQTLQRDIDRKAAEEARMKAYQESQMKKERDIIQSRIDDTGVTGSNYNQAANERGGGGGNAARNAGGQTAREATYDGNPNTGTSQGYSQHYMDGGRVYYMNGGLADMLEIYD